jgi:chitodextrinase
MLPSLIRLLVCSLLWPSLATHAFADQVTLAWDPPATGPAPAGYRVRYGPEGLPATQDADARDQTTLTVTSLVPGTTYAFHVVAYDNAGRTSGPSNVLRVSTAVPPPPAPPPPPTVTTPFFPTGSSIGLSAGQPFQLFLAEGAHSSTFTTRLALANPTSQSATATVYLRREGESRSHIASVTLPARSHTEMGAGSIVGDQSGAFGIGVTSSRRIGVSRTMTWGAGGGAHEALAIATPSSRWYFADGSTRAPFALFYHLLNPGPADASVLITYFLASGASFVRYHDIPPATRRTVAVDAEDLALRDTEVSAVIESINGQPIVAERAMYQVGKKGYAGGHVSPGATEARTNWFLAEGATGPYFDMHLVLTNPNDRLSPVDLRFTRRDGTLVRKRALVPGRGRVSLRVADLDPLLADTSLWTEVTTAPTLPIVVERAMWWPGHTPLEGHVSVAVPQPARRWLAVGGEHGGPQRRAHYINVVNASASSQSVRLTVLGPTGPLRARVVQVAPFQRHDVDAAAVFPMVTGSYSVLVEAVRGAGRLVVEQSSYWDVGGRKWAAGTSRPAQPLHD